LIVISFQGIELKYFDNVPITIEQNGTVLYDGISGCADVDSGGDTTKVSIKGGWLCFFPKAYYVGRDIKVSGLKSMKGGKSEQNGKN
jgi:hypothetical protein